MLQTLDHALNKGFLKHQLEYWPLVLSWNIFHCIGVIFQSCIRRDMVLRSRSGSQLYTIILLKTYRHMSAASLCNIIYQVLDLYKRRRLIISKARVHTPGQTSKTTYEKNIFLRRLSLSRFLEKTRKANKLALRKLFKKSIVRSRR